MSTTSRWPRGRSSTASWTTRSNSRSESTVAASIVPPDTTNWDSSARRRRRIFARLIAIPQSQLVKRSASRSCERPMKARSRASCTMSSASSRGTIRATTAVTCPRLRPTSAAKAAGPPPGAAATSTCSLPTLASLRDGRTRLRWPTEPAAAGRLDPDDVAGGEVARHLRGDRVAVERVAPGSPGLAAPLALRPMRPALGDDREPARLEHAELADDAVAAAMLAVAARAEAQAVPLDQQRVLELERLHGCRERVRHRDVDTARTVGVGTGSLPAADRLVVGEPVVSERDVVHRPLSLGRHLDRPSERAHDRVDDPGRGLDVPSGDGGRRARVDEASLRREDGHGREGAA